MIDRVTDYDWAPWGPGKGRPFGALKAATTGMKMNDAVGQAIAMLEHDRNALTYGMVRMRQTPAGREQLASLRLGFTTWRELLALYDGAFGEILKRLDTAEARSILAEDAGIILPTGKPKRTRKGFRP